MYTVACVLKLVALIIGIGLQRRFWDEMHWSTYESSPKRPFLILSFLLLAFNFYVTLMAVNFMTIPLKLEIQMNTEDKYFPGFIQPGERVGPNRQIYIDMSLKQLSSKIQQIYPLTEGPSIPDRNDLSQGGLKH